MLSSSVMIADNVAGNLRTVSSVCLSSSYSSSLKSANTHSDITGWDQAVQRFVFFLHLMTHEGSWKVYLVFSRAARGFAIH